MRNVVTYFSCYALDGWNKTHEVTAYSRLSRGSAELVADDERDELMDIQWLLALTFLGPPLPGPGQAAGEGCPECSVRKPIPWRDEAKDMRGSGSGAMAGRQLGRSMIAVAELTPVKQWFAVETLLEHPFT